MQGADTIMQPSQQFQAAVQPLLDTFQRQLLFEVHAEQQRQKDGLEAMVPARHVHHLQMAQV